MLVHQRVVEKLPNHNNDVHCLKVYDVYVDTVARFTSDFGTAKFGIDSIHGGFKPLLLLVKILTKHEPSRLLEGLPDRAYGEIPTTIA